MISTDLARELRASGLIWRPRSGDRFQLDEPEFEADVYTVSDMTVEARSYPTGDLLAFNGTTEWALDSVALEDALWLPSEAQLREMLRGTFRALRRLPDIHEVEIEVDAASHVFRHPQPADAYAQAVLFLLRRAA
ncbi:pilus assembly protein CpaE [Microbacterium sp. MM2322]|uniref:pilus assembly protein CpaE n=1 Tax=Microbacterium sp. MM2322 TaxID=3157631 RepID=UPI0032D5826D